MMETLLDWIRYSARRLRNYMNWRSVRGLSELRVLTRVSYLMLVLVPLLAGLWPAVRLVVNQHNRAVEESVTVMKSATKRFEHVLARVDSAAGTSDAGMKLSKETESFLASINRYQNDFAARALDQPSLPPTWVRAFLAALLVALAHFLYQLGAPEAVRQRTLDAFVRDRKEEHANFPSELSIERARNFSSTRIGAREHERRRYEAKRVIGDLLERTVPGSRQDAIEKLDTRQLRQIAEDIDEPDSLPREHVEVQEAAREVLARSKDAVPGKVSPAELAFVERGASAEYLVQAARNPLLMIATAVLYLGGLYLLALVVYTQATAVKRAAGLDSIWSVFGRMSG